QEHHRRIRQTHPFHPVMAAGTGNPRAPHQHSRRCAPTSTPSSRQDRSSAEARVAAPLDNLHDFYQPPPPAWTPQTIGWYVVFAVIALLAMWMTIHTLRRWLANRYRREALRELALLQPEQFSTLLKRTALSAWPRDRVASLSGDTWLKF